LLPSGFDVWIEDVISSPSRPPPLPHLKEVTEEEFEEV
jgi:hypothetical protein